MRIKTKDIATVRTDLLQQQGHLCAVCNRQIEADPVLDHCHKSGAIRATLHRQCNAYLGRIENNAARHGLARDTLGDFLRGAADYLDKHSTDQTALEHPTHRTPEEKKQRAKDRAKQRRLRDK